VVREEIRIRGKETPVIDEVILTRHGPLLNGTLGVPTNAPPLAQRTINDECPPPTEAMLRINRAPDWPAFREALSLWTFPVLNFVYADVDGTIAYKLAGRVPIRARGDGFVPAPGWTGEYEWVGQVPFDELPEAVNPPDGVFASANSRPAAPCKHFLARDWVDDSRWQRIVEMLATRPRVSMEDCRQMQVDEMSLPAREVARRLNGLRLNDALAVRALNYLSSWDGKLDAASVAATIYEVFRRELVRRVGRDLPPPLLDYVHGQGLDEALAAVSAFHHRASSHLIGYLDTVATPEMLAESFQAAVDWLRHKLGTEPARWQWGRLHTITFLHPIGQAAPLLDRLLGLSRGPFPIGGDADTIAQAGVDPWHPFTASTFVVSYRQLFDVGDWDRGQFVLPSGQSGHPGSPHYANMLGAWRRGEYYPMVFTRPAVERETTETINLKPG
jgi:penicillin amidase